MLPPVYPPEAVMPFRNELNVVGLQDLITPQDGDKAVAVKGVTLCVINSVCGCAAGNARPGLALASRHGTKPTGMITVFAGNDPEAASRLRGHMKEIPPSSPFFALFKDGKIVHAVPRHEIEGRSPQDVAANLAAAFDKYCGAAAKA